MSEPTTFTKDSSRRWGQTARSFPPQVGKMVVQTADKYVDPVFAPGDGCGIAGKLAADPFKGAPLIAVPHFVCEVAVVPGGKDVQPVGFP